MKVKSSKLVVNTTLCDKSQQAMSLLEVMVVITIFAVLGILVTQSVVLTLQGAKKSESIIRARENLDYSLSIMERQIRNASAIYGDATYTIPCSGSSDTSAIYYKDQDGYPTSFSCQQMGSDNSYVASGSARLTSNAVRIVDCAFACTAESGSNTSLVTIDLTMQEASASGIQSTNVSASTQIYLRNF